MSSTSLTIALSHAVAYLTRNLPLAYPLTSVTSLRLALLSSLATHYSASWDERNPTSGSGRRCLTLTPTSTPPRPIYTAAKASGVEWKTWASLLGGVEMNLFVDPGSVRVRSKACQDILVWSAAAEAALKAPSPVTTTTTGEDMKTEARAALRQAMHSGTRSRMLRSLAVETSNLTPPSTTFTRGHSRSSSLSSAVSETSERSAVSDASSLFSAVSAVSAATSIASAFSPKEVSKPAPAPSMFVTPPTPAVPAMKKAPLASPVERKTPEGPYKMSRREKARQRRTGIVCAPPAEVTPYDGGKTTVLGGGIRLGSARMGVVA